MKISQRAAQISPSPTVGMAARAKQMIREGLDVISFAVGEPDFATPEHICRAAQEAMEAGHTKYTAASGILELKEAVVARLRAEVGLNYDADQVCISNGGKHALANIWQTLLDEGDEVIIFAPYWVSYPAQIQLCGGRPKAVMTDASRGFQPDPAEVRRAVTPRTVAVLLNSPANPTGSIFDRETLQEIATIAAENDLTIVSDEIYRNLIFDGRQHLSIAMLDEETKARTILVDGVSKSYAMTGWRIGWLIGPRQFVAKCSSIQSQQTSAPSSISQYAALAALTGPQDCVARMRAQFEQRRNFFVKALGELEGIKCNTPPGAFYVFPDISAHLGRNLAGRQIDTSLQLAEYLLEEGLISTVPGAAFGAEGFLRLSFACSAEDIKRGLQRLKTALGI